MRHNVPMRFDYIDNRQTFELESTAGSTTAIGKADAITQTSYVCDHDARARSAGAVSHVPSHECLLQERRSAGGVVAMNSRWQTDKTRGYRRFEFTGRNRQGKNRGRKSGEIIEGKLTCRIVGRIILERVLMAIRCGTANMFQRIGECHLLRKQQKQRQPDT